MENAVIYFTGSSQALTRSGSTIFIESLHYSCNHVEVFIKDAGLKPDGQKSAKSI